MILAVSLLMLAQVGPFTPPGGSRLPPPAIEGREGVKRSPPTTAPAPRPALASCFAQAAADPAAALAAAEAAKSADALSCKAVALVGLERWAEAEAAFLAARDALPAADKAARAQQEAGAAIAAGEQGAFARAVEAYGRAHGLATEAGDPALVGRIARDRAEPLYRAGRKDEALASLAEARAALPDDPLTWTISARAARSMNRLAEAQGFIEHAAQLDPRDPAIGLEAGIIAMLSGREEAARRSWQSVIATAPDSDAGSRAKGYLEQIGPATTLPK